MQNQIPIMPGDLRSLDRVDALYVLQYVSPVLVIAYYLLASTVSLCSLQKARSSGTSPRKTLLWLMSLVALSYMVEACMLVLDSLANHARFSSTNSNIFALSSLLIWVFIVVSLVQNKHPIWYPFYGSWLIALSSEALIISFELAKGSDNSAFVICHILVQACRLLLLIALPTVFLSRRLERSTSSDEESSPLLGQDKKSANGTKPIGGSPVYGALSAESSKSGDESEDEDTKEEDKDRKKLEKRLQDSGNVFNYISSFSILFPLLWPSKNRWLQFYIVGVVLCLLAGRALNVLVPRQFGILLDSLDMAYVHIPITEAALYMLFHWLANSVVAPLRYFLWDPIELNAQAAIKKAAYNQIMDLSCDFHTEKRSGELYTSVQQGSSVVGLLDSIIFRTVPMMMDIIVALFYLWSIFGPYMALLVAATTLTYLWCSVFATSKIVEPQRKRRMFDRKEFQLMYDTVGGWSSVCYFNRHAYEKNRYSSAVDLAMLWDRIIGIFYRISSTAQDSVIDAGLIAGGILAIYQISNGSHKVGSFAMLMSYWGNFTARLAYFAYIQQQIRHGLVDAESLLELLQKKPTVKDGVDKFAFQKGTIDFHNVGFSYDGKKEIIKDFNFHAGFGQKIALVGETGGGKSTILKLLFRFYDVTKGKIMIDGQDIKDVTLESLRRCFGVVPQDPELFNTNIIDNVRYAKLEASDEEVVEACKGAAIHDKILTFTDSYQSKVGEKGVKLSGGELQRIAIARVLLKNPEIVLLDEATSAVDTETESHIQAALQKLSDGRTTITIAHRLSTVTTADIIVVIKGGKIVEQGSPQALLAAKGTFSELWLKQVGITLAPEKESVDKPINPLEKGQADQADHDQLQLENGPDVRKRSTQSSSSSTKSLRPTAPEFVPRKGFVPRNQRGTPTQSGQSSNKKTISSHQDSTSIAASKQVSGKKSDQHKQHTSDDAGYDSQWDTCDDSKTDGPNKTVVHKKRQNPIKRRRDNRSDPSGSTCASTQFDGPSGDPTPNVSGDESGRRLQSRRVSAPAGSSSAAVNARGPGAAQYRGSRVGRRAKKREKAALNAASSSGEASGALSGDTLHPSTPNARTDGSNNAATSAGGPTSAKNGTGSVHFAPDA